MKVLINVVLEELENEINRQIEVDENIQLSDLCEYIIVSMDGNKIPFYILDYKDISFYPYDIEESDEEKSIFNITLKDLKIKRGDKLGIEYNFEHYYINIVVDAIYDNNIKEINDFEVLSGKGYGLLDNERIYNLKYLLTDKRRLNDNYYSKEIRDYLYKKFDYIEVNNKIKEYIEHREYLFKPKRYIFNVSLYGFDKEIKRKIIVNSDITIDDFERKIILSMNGDLSHGYGIKRNKEYLDECYDDIELFYLDLKEKQRLKVIYDWGDSWVFNLTVSKIVEDYGVNNFEVLSGKGYGIVDDCGGIWGLEDLINNSNFNINNFDLDKINEKLNKY